MLKGNNTLLVNQSTMNQIVQEWIGRNIKGSHVVTSVTMRNDPTSKFEITMKTDDVPDRDESQNLVFHEVYQPGD